MIHANEKPYKCKECDLSFKFGTTLKVHKMLHPEQKPNKNKECAQNLPDLSILPTQNVCKYCQQYFTDVSTLETHKMMHIEEKPHKCTVCDNVFSDISALENHMTLHKEQNQKSHELYQLCNVAGNVMDIYQKCQDCTQLFVNLTALDSHRVKCIKEKPVLCSETKLLFPLTKQNTCAICQRIVKGPLSQMNRHMLIHSGKKPHKCTQCLKSFLWSRGLKSHMTVHIENRIPYKDRETPYKCDQCDKSFSLQVYLRRHIKSHEAMNKYLSCKSCPLVFKTQSSLANHNFLRHTEHKCSECDKFFTSTNLLKRHKWSHVKEKPHKCPNCEKSFGQAAHLKSHVQTHIRGRKKQFKCNHGPSESRDQDNIFKHIHIGTHPFACDMCNKKFRRFSGLKDHCLTHKNTKQEADQ